MALQELVLSSSATLTCMHDLRTGSLLTSFKSSTTNSDALLSSDIKGKGRASDNSSSSSSSSSVFTSRTDYSESCFGVGGVIASIVPGGKAAVNIWSFQKEAPLQRLLTPVKLVCLALSKNGIHLAGGTQDGRILLWELSSGALLASFDAHYRAVTCLAWTDDGAALLSASDDAACHVWSLAILLASSSNPMLPVTPYLSLADHTLPITSIHVSFGSFPNTRVTTSSLDGTCKLWDLSQRPYAAASSSSSATNGNGDINYSSSWSTTDNDPSGGAGGGGGDTINGTLLSSFTFPSPEQATHVQLDALERSFFAATFHPGTGRSKVYKVDLYRQVRRGGAGSAENGSDDAMVGGGALDGLESGSSWEYEAVGGGGRGDTERIPSASNDNGSRPGFVWVLPSTAGGASPSSNNTNGGVSSATSAQSERISSMHLSKLSASLLIGTSKGIIHLLSLPSLQSIKQLNPSQSTSTSSIVVPITSIFSLLEPSDLIVRSASASQTLGAGTTSSATGSTSTSSTTFVRGARSVINHSSSTSHGAHRDDGAGGAGGGGIILPPIATQLSRTIVQPHEMANKVAWIRLAKTKDATRDILPRIPAFFKFLSPSSSSSSSWNAVDPAWQGPSSSSSYGTSTTALASSNGVDAHHAGGNLVEENARLREQLAKAIALNDRMWQGLVDASLNKAKVADNQGAEQ